MTPKVINACFRNARENPDDIARWLAAEGADNRPRGARRQRNW